MNYDTLFLNAHLITMSDNDYGILRDAYIGVKGRKISDIGVMSSLDLESLKNTNIELIDLKSKWVSPGLIDCHTHLVYGGNRSHEFAMRQQGASYTEIAESGGGILSTVKATRAANQEELLEQSQKRLESLLAEGITRVEIKSGYGLDTANEIKMLETIKQLGIQNEVHVHPTFLGAHALPPEFQNQPDEYISYIIDEMLPTIRDRDLSDTVDAFCETIGFNTEQVKRLFDAAKALNFNVKLHAEQLSDQKGSQLAAKFNALSVDHIEYISTEGVSAIAQSGTVAVLLPGAFYYLKETQKPPIDALRSKKIPMAIATDANPGSSPTTSIQLMMNMACIFFGFTTIEAWQSVTTAAAKALGVADVCGKLECGMEADFAIWNFEHPDELPYQFGRNCCVGRVVSGTFI